MCAMRAAYAAASPAAGPVAESALSPSGRVMSRSDSNACEQPTPSPARPTHAAAIRASNDSRGSTANTMPHSLRNPAGSSDNGTFGLDGEAEGAAHTAAVRKWAARLPFAAMFGSVHGRSTLDGSLHRRVSKVSQLSWEPGRRQDSGGPRWTRALMFPSTVEGFLARVRWQAFLQDVTQLAEQMMRLHQTAKNVLLHLPGPEGVADPTVVPDADLW